MLFHVTNTVNNRQTLSLSTILTAAQDAVLDIAQYDEIYRSIKFVHINELRYSQYFKSLLMLVCMSIRICIRNCMKNKMAEKKFLDSLIDSYCSTTTPRGE